MPLISLPEWSNFFLVCVSFHVFDMFLLASDSPRLYKKPHLPAIYYRFTSDPIHLTRKSTTKLHNNCMNHTKDKFRNLAKISMLCPHLYVFTAAACGWGILSGTAVAQPPASVTVDPTLIYNITTLIISGNAICYGGGKAGVTVVDGSLEQMFRGGVGGPMAVQLDGPVLIDCDGEPHAWSGHLIAPGRALPNESGGMVTVTLSQGPNVIASTGPQPVHIVAS
ncbi:hypothetical protein FBU30_001710 [Linnemannia zychae]|nr:hypothetical protein FBU30_001710 [Linnemannia zychae]